MNRLAATIAVLALGLACPVLVHGQLRGMPLFFESTSGYQSRLGVEVGGWGELDGVTLAGEGAYHFGVGRRRRVSVGGAIGMWDPRGAGPRVTAAASTQVRLDPPPEAGSVKRFTVRGITAIAGVSNGDGISWSIPVGIGLGYAFVAPIVRIEPWIVPQIVWRSGGVDSWKAELSTGVTIGGGKIGGLRLGTQCCVGGLGWAVSVSKWF